MGLPYSRSKPYLHKGFCYSCLFGSSYYSACSIDARFFFFQPHHRHGILRHITENIEKKKHQICCTLILNIRSSSQALIRICSEMTDYNRENSIVFLMGNLTWSYSWCSTSHRVHCGLEYWWRWMSLRITDLQNPIWTSLVFVLSYICMRVLVG